MDIEKSGKTYNKKKGDYGEKRARSFLKKRGYKILEHNYTCPFGEADIIARKGDVIIFAEVKTRFDYEFCAPKESVTRAKQQRYIKIAKYFLNADINEYTVRFDVLEVYGKERIEHIENAF